jgi:hypothetical protein
MPFTWFKPKPPHKHLRVLFVDGDGGCLAPLARAFASASFPAVDTQAAGIEPGSVRLDVASWMEPKGFSTGVTCPAVWDFVGKGFDTVVTLGVAAGKNCPDFGPDVDRLHWGVTDPFSDPSKPVDPEAIAHCAEDLEKRVTMFFNQK